MYIYIYVYDALGTRQTFIDIRQSILAVSNSKQVYCSMTNWCIWISDKSQLWIVGNSKGLRGTKGVPRKGVRASVSMRV